MTTNLNQLEIISIWLPLYKLVHQGQRRLGTKSLFHTNTSRQSYLSPYRHDSRTICEKQKLILCSSSAAAFTNSTICISQHCKTWYGAEIKCICTKNIAIINQNTNLVSNYPKHQQSRYKDYSTIFISTPSSVCTINEKLPIRHWCNLVQGRK